MDISDIPSILESAGCSATNYSVVAALTSLDALLPGLHDGALSFQELLAIHKIHCLHPIADDDLPTAKKAWNSAQTEKVSNRGTTEGTNSWRYLETEESKKTPIKTKVLSLPTRSNIRQEPPLTASEIKRVFKQFDVTGEQKLTFMGIKTAFELYYDQTNYDTSQENIVDDSFIREWIKTYDRGLKGFVDLSDFNEIYNEADGQNFKSNSNIQSNKVHQKAPETRNVPNNHEVPSEDVLRR